VRDSGILIEVFKPIYLLVSSLLFSIIIIIPH